MMATRDWRVHPTTTIQTAHIPAPLGGMNTVAAGTAIPQGDCIYAYNLIAAEYGLRSRLGWQEWVTGLTGVINNAVRTLLPFKGATESQDRLFAVTSTGIWDVSTSGTSPTKVLDFVESANNAGRGVGHTVVTSAGHFLLYCDEENGLHVYTASTGLWARVAEGGGGSEISNVNPANLVFVTVFKNRVWLVEKGTARAWYLAAGSIYGAATAFEMGTKFRAGGHLVGLWNWTYDGGAGIDDSLVAISGGGDVLVWQLTNPASPGDTLLRGVWYTGGVTTGRRIATPFGGDMLISSLTGILPIKKLVVGGSVDEDQYATADIRNLYSNLANTYRTVPGWAMHIHPTDNALLVTVPTAGQDAATAQLAMSFATGGWSRYRDLPMLSAEVWNGELFFGTADGRVCRNRGYVDGVTLADPNTYLPVEWSLLTRYENLGNARQKRVEMLRPTLLSEVQNPRVEARALYNFNLNEPAAPTGSLSSSGGDSWDSAVWDTAVWGGEYVANQPMRGAVGMGRDVAIAIRGSAISRTTLVGVDVLFNQGGVM